MRTLKTFIIGASLLLFAMPAIAVNYPPEMPDIKNAPVQFVCKTPTVFLKMYLHQEKHWQVSIWGQKEKELIIEILIRTAIYNDKFTFVAVPPTNQWKNVNDVNEKEIKAYEQSHIKPTKEDRQKILTCSRENFRSRGLLQ